MTIEALPTFTKPARQRWDSIPADIRQRLLSNVWCGQCRFETTITHFSGTIKGRDLLLVGNAPNAAAMWRGSSGARNSVRPRAGAGFQRFRPKPFPDGGGYAKTQ